MFQVLILVSALYTISKCSDLKLISTTRTSVLSKYQTYTDAIVMAVNIPKDTSFMSLNFSAEELDMSVFGGCSARNVSLYMKYGAPPVINPDGSKFPKAFKNITRTMIYNLEFKSDKQPYFLNITSPLPGQYVLATFLEYSDPRYDSIKQQGLGPECLCYVESRVSIKKAVNTEIIIDEQEFAFTALNESKMYKFLVPESVDHAILILKDISFSENSKKLVVRVNANTIPSTDDKLASLEISKTEKNGELMFRTVENAWHYLEFIFENIDNNKNLKTLSTMTFKLRYFSSIQKTKTEILIKTLPNTTEQIIYYNKSLTKQFQSTNRLTDLLSYKEYSLVRDSSTDNFVFSYLLEDEVDSVIPIAINVTSEHFSVLKFNIHQRDMGGTLQFILAFKPRVNGRKLVNEPDDHVIIACIRPYNLELPYRPGNCSFNGTLTDSTLVLNKTVDNSSILIPFPESGLWYASFRLFCDKCLPCQCPNKCQQSYTSCLINCQKTCSKDACSDCENSCRESTVHEDGCDVCADCDGPCVRTNRTCNSSIVFDVSSNPCMPGSCGKNGRCVFSISDGVAFSSCLCSNKYRGWDCSDGSLATPFYMVLIELLLLVLSNLAFLPSVYIATKRKYYAEAISYFAICFFSTFYHACDAGENIISFCIVRLGALQFADFFCALLAIWMTLIAMADLTFIYPNLCHIVGAILLGFFTTINKTSFWVFAVPVVSGVLIIGVSWYLKYRKIKQLICKKAYITIYLPLGVIWATAGLLIYALLQTTDNYKYLHSMWHVIMAVAVIILLPKPDTFHPNNLL